MTGFEQYLADYEGARGDAMEAVDSYARCKAPPVRREELVVEARACIDEVERLIRVLENEANEERKATEKRKLMDKVRHCKTQFVSLQSSLEKAMLLGESHVIGTETPASTGSKEEATRYAERLDRNGRHLDDTQRVLAETESIAANTANNLMQQRNQLEHAQIDVTQAQEDTKEAGSHLRRLAIKAVTNKIILVLVMLALTAAIALVSYYKWYPRDKKDYLGILPNTTAPAATSASGGTS